MEFSKISGTGNDFILIDNREALVAKEAMPDFVRCVCRRAVSVGADGVIFIEKHPELDFAWNFYNSDGGEAEMCGNGARCAARFAYERGIAGKSMKFLTGAGVIEGHITGDGIAKVLLTKAHGFREFHFDIEGESFKGLFINTGVPHAVIPCDDVEAVEVPKTGALVRYAKEFAPAGANANFVQKTGDHELVIRTYERGVENETLACGTGCVAAALTLAEKGIVKAPVELKVRSGEKLRVDFSPESPIDGDAWLEGAVHWIYDGVFKDALCLK